MAIGKDKDDEDQFDDVAEDAAKPEVDDAAEEQDASKAKAYAQSQAKKKQAEIDEDEAASKKGKGSKK